MTLFQQTSNVNRLQGANFAENAQRNSSYLIQKVGYIVHFVLDHDPA